MINFKYDTIKVNPKSKYLPKKGDKIVRFNWKNNGHELNDWSSIQTDSEGREYFYIPNIYISDEMHLFLGRIKDAVQSVKDGDGDAITGGRFLDGPFNFMQTSVIRYVDREYGEKIRKESIHGWKYAIFVYCIQLTQLASFSSGSFIGKKENDDKDRWIAINGFYKPEKSMRFEFESEEKAQNAIDKKNNWISEQAKKYTSLEDDDKKRSFIDEFINKSSVEFDLLYSLLKELRGEDKVYKLEVVQSIKEK